MTQAALLCGCGAALEPRTTAQNACALGRCTKCERRARLNRERFDGFREARLREDEYRCVGCGNLDGARRLVVHHRRPGRNALALLVTLCRGCHKAVHLDPRPSYAFVTLRPELYRLWREINRRQPEQLLLFGAAPAGVQAELFARSDNGV
jgi:hypothetical protein